MINHAERQRRITIDENLEFIEDNVSQEARVMGARRRAWPVGSRYFWALQQVWCRKPKIVQEQKPLVAE